jgi:hypothetical protein
MFPLSFWLFSFTASCNTHRHHCNKRAHAWLDNTIQLHPDAYQLQHRLTLCHATTYQYEFINLMSFTQVF